MEKSVAKYESNMNLRATELRLGLPGSEESEKQSPPTPSTIRINKRSEPDRYNDSNTGSSLTAAGGSDRDGAHPPAKAQVVGWPPIRSYRKNSLQQSKKTETDVAGRLVKVSVDGAPYLRKIDLKVYESYSQLLKALEQMFKLTIGKYSEREGYNGSDYSPTYEDKDGDWMLVGDVPWEMFLSSCKRMRIMKGSRRKKLDLC